MTDFSGIHLGALTDPAAVAAWQANGPFCHAVIDNFVTDQTLAELMTALDDEPADIVFDEIYEMRASAPVVVQRRLAAFHGAFGGQEVCAAISALCGTVVGRIDLRAFSYEPGHYLLPHTDHQPGVGRVVAYAFYLATSPDLKGGELVLYDSVLKNGEIVRAAAARVIPPRANRLVLFQVGDTSLHEVREVTCGQRVSLAGWFYSTSTDEGGNR